MKLLKLYVFSLFIFLVLDGIWLGYLAKDFYSNHLSDAVNISFRPIGALLFYCFYVIGILYFSVIPSIKNNNWKEGFKKGAFLGALCYGTYDFTNYATILEWPLTVVAVDIVWGILITGFTAGLVSYISITRFNAN